MISCDSFRARFEPGSEDPAVLEHIRSCDRCLDVAAQADPDMMFRALGGDELIPPGGVDSFVDDVMQQVRVRGAESTVSASSKVVSWPRRLAVAATLVAGLTGAMLYKSATAYGPASAKPATIDAALRPQQARPVFTTKPVIETYESDNATIVEVPTEDTG
ncbi:MAG TPA: hypothetical protein VE010_13140, partial [Thermoanaerobaculia bacterium]|nr:hypothetical protein [Thermoanaerobaculia bacterium]